MSLIPTIAEYVSESLLTITHNYHMYEFILENPTGNALLTTIHERYKQMLHHSLVVIEEDIAVTEGTIQRDKVKLTDLQNSPAADIRKDLLLEVEENEAILQDAITNKQTILVNLQQILTEMKKEDLQKADVLNVIPVIQKALTTVLQAESKMYTDFKKQHEGLIKPEELTDEEVITKGLLQDNWFKSRITVQEENLANLQTQKLEINNLLEKTDKALTMLTNL